MVHVLGRRRFLAFLGMMSAAVLPSAARGQGAISNDTLPVEVDPTAPVVLPEGIPADPDEIVSVDIGSWRVISSYNNSRASIADGKATTTQFAMQVGDEERGGTASLELAYWSTRGAYEGTMTVTVIASGAVAAVGGVSSPTRIIADGEVVDSFVVSRGGSGDDAGQQVRDALMLFGDDLSKLVTIGTLQVVMEIEGEDHVVFEVALEETAAMLEQMRLIPDYNYNIRRIGNVPVGAPPPDFGGSTTTETNCFLTTACCELVGLPDDCFELRALRRFRDDVLAATPGGRADIALYYERAPRILSAMAQRGETQRLLPLYFSHILPSAVLARLGLKRLPDRLYRNLMARLTRRYLPV
jgi:hypothetical protein